MSYLDEAGYLRLAEEHTPRLVALLHAALDSTDNDLARRHFASLADRIESKPIRDFLAFALGATEESASPELERNFVFHIGTESALLAHYETLITDPAIRDLIHQLNHRFYRLALQT